MISARPLRAVSLNELNYLRRASADATVALSARRPIDFMIMAMASARHHELARCACEECEHSPLHAFALSKEIVRVCPSHNS